MSNRTLTILFAALAAGALPIGCATAPKTAAQQQGLEQRADATLSEMLARDPTLSSVIDHALAYAIFPDVGKGGVIVGGAYGRGILYEHGRPAGFVSLQQASVGAQLGGETFSELLVLHDPNEIARLKLGSYELGADVGAVALTTGAGAAARFDQNASVFVMPHGGLMVDVSVVGQKIDYLPLAG